MNRLIAALTIATAALTASAREPHDTMDGIFNERIRTVTMSVDGNRFAPPVVFMGMGAPITIEFDHLSDDRVFLRYRVVRCDANWQPSTLAEAEYLDGFNESIIEDYEYSRGTTVHYVHYGFQFPNADIAPKLSGNYLIEVYSEDDPDDVWMTRRVMLSEQSAPISTAISSRTDIDYNEGHQQLSVAVDTERARVSDPFNDLKVMIAQNGRCDNEVMLRQPLRMSGFTAIYEHSAPLIFEAGNEYRRMEVADVNYPGMGVADIEWADPYYHFTLFDDQPRAEESYVYDSTQHGRFFVRQYNSDESATEADYVVVHFALVMPEMPGTMIFLDGDFTSRRFDQSSLMTFNHATGRYEKVLLLKQGHYNYQYLTVAAGARSGTAATIEGNKYQTINEYLIKVYTRSPLDRTDRLIGVTQITSQP